MPKDKLGKLTDLSFPLARESTEAVRRLYYVTRAPLTAVIGYLLLALGYTTRYENARRMNRKVRI